ncbi:MAG: hypothetical protein WCT04_12950 [Planctomycetota bacterium]
MTPGLALLQRYLLEGRVLRSYMFGGKPLDDVLNERCLDCFDIQCQRVFRELELHTRNIEIPEDELTAVNDVREAAYRTALAFSTSPEMATAICDDFELLGASLAAGYNDPWLNGLWLSYRAGKIPQGELEMADGALEDLIDY